MPGLFMGCLYYRMIRRRYFERAEMEYHHFVINKNIADNCCIVYHSEYNGVRKSFVSL